MIMHFESVKRNPVDYVEGKYLLLYPLLNDYWDKSLSEMPEDLRARAKHVIRCWDDIGGLYPSEQGDSLLMPRQEQIKIYDMQRDDTQERETYIALHGYLNGGEVGGERGKGGYFVEGQLKQQIEKAQASGNDVLAEFMSTEVSRPLQQICDEVGMHWLNPEPLLWRAICKFRWLTLQGILASTERENNFELVQNLRDVNTYLYRIINLDRDRIRRVREELEESWETSAAVLKSQQSVTVEKNSDDNVVLISRHSATGELVVECENNPQESRTKLFLGDVFSEYEREDPLTIELDAILRGMSKNTPTRVMAKLREQIGKPHSCITANLGDGLQWERDKGVVEELKINALSERIRTWRKKEMQAKHRLTQNIQGKPRIK